jgi:hypothetical protein
MNWTNESQKPVNDKYRNNWDEIFDKNIEEKEEKIEVEIEADNDHIKITKTWEL